MAGELDVEAMLRRHTAKWFRDWRIYHDLEPFGEFRADVRAAQIAMMIFNMAVAVKDRKPLDHFLLKWGEEEKEDVKPTSTKTLQERGRKQTWQEQQKIMELLAIAFNAQTPGSKSIQG